MFWHGQAVIRKGMKPDRLQNMFQAGCRSMDYGLESGSTATLRRMKKPYSAETASEVLRDTAKAGIISGINIIVGFPGESEEEFQETMAFLSDNKGSYKKIANLSTCLITPQSDIDNNPDKYGVHVPPTDDFWYTWEDTLQPSNATNALRKEKLQEVIDFTKREGIPVEYVYAN